MLVASGAEPNVTATIHIRTVFRALLGSYSTTDRPWLPTKIRFTRRSPAVIEALAGSVEQYESGWTEATIGLLAAGVEHHYSFARWAVT